ncbi:MAG: hypothetical protein SCH70_14865, partial [Candidatus Methanoperedens sp.]|nr:hypothetical protein [Candidatus Methanoperedens sp.]
IDEAQQLKKMRDENNKKVGEFKLKRIYIELNGSEKNELIAEMLSNDEIKKLKNELIAHGHTPEVNNASVGVAINNVNSNTSTVVIIPFKPADGFTLTGISYTKIGESSHGVAVEQYIIDNKTYANIYYIDELGNIALEEVDIDWECWSGCMADQCACCIAGITCPLTACDICCVVCATCLAAPIPTSPLCIGCYICAGAISAYCAYECP